MAASDSFLPELVVQQYVAAVWTREPSRAHRYTYICIGKLTF